jgi:membrane-bound inhibitor of C-type lysozyme
VAVKRSLLAVAVAAIAIVGLSANQCTNEQPKFSCHGGKTVSATFYSNSVELKLSDGRSLNMPLSGSRARYANSDETFVFWNKGDTAFITEGNGKETYSGCVVAK